MGLRFSFSNKKSSRAAGGKPKVTVITPEGVAREFSMPVFAYDALLGAGETHFICSSDTLYFDSEVSDVGPDELLLPGQLYFMLPDSMLGCTLSSADMAALAVKASSALRPSNPKRRTGKGKRLQLGPSTFAPYEENERLLNQRLNEDTLRAGGSRPSVARRGVRRGSTSNRRPRVVRRRLGTIEEVS